MLDKPINVNIGPRRDGDVESLIADITKIRDTISWKPKYSKLSEILSSALAWEMNIPKLKQWMKILAFGLAEEHQAKDVKIK